MGFLKKIRKNILNQDNSFHIGFGNRSPFSYTNQYGGDWTPEVPAIETPETDLGEMDLLKAQIGLAGDIRDAGIDIAQAYKKHEDELVDPHRKSKRLEKRADRIRERSFKASSKNTKRGDIKSDRLDDKEYDIWLKSIKAKKEEDKKIAASTPTGKTSNKQQALILAKLDCDINQGTWDSTTNTCSKK